MSVPKIRAMQPAFIYDKDNGGTVKVYFTYPSSSSTNMDYIIFDPNRTSTWGSNKIQEETTAGVRAISGDRDNEYYIEIQIGKSLMSVNQFYHIQIWPHDDTNAVSQVSLIRPIPAITVSFDQSGSVTKFPVLSGHINNSQETLDSYYCTIGDWTSPVIQGSGSIFEIPIDNRVITEGPSYDVYFYYTTIHGYQGSEDTAIRFSAPSGSGSLLITKNVNNGSLIISGASGTTLRRSISGSSDWWDLVNIPASTSNWEDFTIESGVSYQYLGSSPITSMISFDDIFLSNPDTMMAVKFNPNISNLKYVVQEAITNTLGGRYPIIRRNGDTKYRQFNLSGSIFIEGNIQQKDANGDILSSNDSQTSALDMNNFFQDEYCLFSTKDNPLNVNGDTVKDVVETRACHYAMEFLCDNRPKLFRSAEEGNMIVHLSNISFTPNKQLGRHIYDFSATVTEVCEYTIENLKKYKLNLGGYSPVNVIRKAPEREAVTIK